MKTKLYIIALLGVFQMAQAQPQVLIENTWYLQKLIVDGEEIPIPVNEEITDLALYFREDELDTVVCSGSDIGAHGLVYVDDNRFTVEGYYGLLMACTLFENRTFSHLYFENIFDYNSDRENNTLPINYILKPINGNIKELVLTTLKENVAIYTNQRLSTTTFEKSSFKIYPNPARDMLYLEFDDLDYNFPKHIEIYDLLGKLCLQQTLTTEEKSIPLNHLSSGTYIVKIQNTDGVVLASEKIIIK